MQAGHPATGVGSSTEALDQVYRQAYGQLRGVALRFVSPQDADDLVHEAFVRALKGRHRFRHEASPATWLHRIVVNSCIDARRRHSRRGIAVPFDEAMGEGSHCPSPVERRAVRRALRVLSADDQAVCILYDIIGYTHQEIAVALDIPVGTSKSRLSVARRRLRAMLAGGGAAGAESARS